MSKQAPTVEWQIAESDADWERMRGAARPDSEPTTVSGRRLNRYCWGVVALFLLLSTGGFWWWHMRPGRLQQAEAEGTAQPVVSGIAQRPDRFVATARDLQSDPGWWLRHGQEVQELRTAAQTAEPGARLDITVRAAQKSYAKGW